MNHRYISAEISVPQGVETDYTYSLLVYYTSLLSLLEHVRLHSNNWLASACFHTGAVRLQQHAHVEAHAVWRSIPTHYSPGETQVWFHWLEYPIRIQPGRPECNHPVYSEPSGWLGSEEGTYRIMFSCVEILKEWFGYWWFMMWLHLGQTHGHIFGYIICWFLLTFHIHMAGIRELHSWQ